MAGKEYKCPNCGNRIDHSYNNSVCKRCCEDGVCSSCHGTGYFHIGTEKGIGFYAQVGKKDGRGSKCEVCNGTGMISSESIISRNVRAASNRI